MKQKNINNLVCIQSSLSKFSTKKEFDWAHLYTAHNFSTFTFMTIHDRRVRANYMSISTSFLFMKKYTNPKQQSNHKQRVSSEIWTIWAIKKLSKILRNQEEKWKNWEMVSNMRESGNRWIPNSGIPSNLKPYVNICIFAFFQPCLVSLYIHMCIYVCIEALQISFLYESTR